MNNKIVMIRKWVLTILLAMVIGSVLILMISENPLDAYAALIKGAFNGKLKFGTTLASFTPLLLTSTAFAVAAKGGAVQRGRLRARYSWVVLPQLYRDQLDLSSGSDPAGNLFPGCHGSGCGLGLYPRFPESGIWGQ